jgi:hypothetical protein
LESLSDMLRSIYNLVSRGNIDNALWEITELEQYMIRNCPVLLEKYYLKTYFIKWRNRLLRTKPNLRVILEEIELLANQLENAAF